jgi:predicted phage replisome organizer/uncharacterized phage protein (TIGR02220 family)
MSDNKRYYYLKLKDNFFDSEEMKILESQKNGIEYQNLYLKLCLLSVKNDGKSAFKGSLPYDLTMLSTILRVSIDTIKVGIEMYITLGLIDKLDSGTMYMSDIQALIGHGSTESERKATYRDRINNEKKLIMGQCPGQFPPEIEIEIEKKKEIEKEIIDFLNLKSQKTFSYCKSNIENITARLKEGRTKEDCFYIIEVKCDEWINNCDMNKYLCPQTLFRPGNFEKYINQKKIIKSTSQNNIPKEWKPIESVSDEQIKRNCDILRKTLEESEKEVTNDEIF